MLALRGGAKGSVESLIGRSQRRCASEKLSKFLRCGSHLSKVRISGSQNRVNIGEFRIGAGCFRREFHRLHVPLRQQGRPALAQMPNDKQRVTRTKPDRLIKERHGGFIITSEAVAAAEIT